jgi:hypothetical protein
MKMKPEICSAVFFIKDTVKSCVLPAVTEVTGTIHEGGNPSWSNLLQLRHKINKVVLLHQLIEEIDQSQEKEKSKGRLKITSLVTRRPRWKGKLINGK